MGKLAAWKRVLVLLAKVARCIPVLLQGSLYYLFVEDQKNAKVW